MFNCSNEQKQFKMTLHEPEAHPRSFVNHVAAVCGDTAARNVISSGFFDRKVIRWEITSGFSAKATSKCFNTYIYSIAIDKFTLFVATAKKVYALDTASLSRLAKFELDTNNNVYADFLLTSLIAAKISNQARLLVAGTDAYAKGNYALSLWTVDERILQERGKNTATTIIEEQQQEEKGELMNDSLDGFDIDDGYEEESTTA